MSGSITQTNPSAATYVSGNPNGTVSGTRGQLAVDPATGTVYQNTDGGTTWTVFTGGGGGGSTVVVVNFTATGGETDFMVPIGVTMANDSYGVSPPGVQNGSFNPEVQLPNQAPSDRTTTQFRVVCTALEAGQVLSFLVVAV